VVVAAFALLATGTDLLAPLIYREAVNDIAGLFVGASPASRTDALFGTSGAAEARTATISDQASPSPARKAAAKKPLRERHRRGHVAPRTASQTLTTLLWAVALLFAINVFSHYCSLVADQRTVRLASRIESDFIRGTFSHVLELPLGFFARRASGTLAQQIDQSD
jgi:ABC-type multidrug transport system fused ATPase/permease subunit